MKSTRHLSRLKEFNQVVKRASPGERVIASTLGRTGSSGTWATNRLEAVAHFRNWSYVYIDCIGSKIASIFPNMAAVVDNPRPGTTVKACQRSLANLMGMGFGGEPYIGGKLDKTWSRPVDKTRYYSDERAWDNTKSTSVNGLYVGTTGWDGSQQSPVSFSDGGHSFLTMGEWRGKALSVIKPHEELEPLEAEHPLRRLMENPNPVDTFFDIEYELYMFRGLTGISYEWTPKNAFGQPCERWCIPSHWVYPRTSGGQYVPFGAEHADELIWDYEIRPYGYPGFSGVLHFPPDEVICTKGKNPMSKIDGWGKTSAGAQWIDEDDSVSQCRWSQMVNMGRPDGVVKLGPGYEDPDEATIARIEAKFMMRLQGVFNFGKPMILPPGADYLPTSFNPSEMAFMESENQIADMLGSLYRVPGAAVGRVKEMTYGSIMATLGSLCVFCLNPELLMQGQNRTKHLASQFDEIVPAWSQSGIDGRDSGGGRYTRRIKIWYDDCVPADPQQVNSDIQLDITAAAITPNEVRALRGRQPYRRGGNDPMVQGAGGLQPLPLNTGEGLDDLAALIAPMTEATGDETGQQQLEGDLAPTEVGVNGTTANGSARPDHEATGLEPPEEPNGEPSKSMVKGTIADLKREAAKYGAKVVSEGSGRWEVYQLEAPSGKTWDAQPGQDTLKVEWLRGDVAHRDIAIKDAIESMSYGVSKLLGHNRVGALGTLGRKKENGKQVKAGEIKVGDVVRFTLGDAWSKVTSVTRPTPAFVAIKTEDGLSDGQVNQGTKVWIKRYEPGTRVSRNGKIGRVTKLRNDPRAGQWVAEVSWDDGRETVEPTSGLQELGGRATALQRQKSVDSVTQLHREALAEIATPYSTEQFDKARATCNRVVAEAGQLNATEIGQLLPKLGIAQKVGKARALELIRQVLNNQLEMWLKYGPRKQWDTMEDGGESHFEEPKPPGKVVDKTKFQTSEQAEKERNRLHQLVIRYAKLRDEAEAELKRAFPSGKRPEGSIGRGYDDRKRTIDEYERNLQEVSRMYFEVAAEVGDLEDLGKSLTDKPNIKKPKSRLKK
jgi:hypothetical protein